MPASTVSRAASRRSPQGRGTTLLRSRPKERTRRQGEALDLTARGWHPPKGMLIDTSEPRGPDPGRPVWEPDLRLCAWVLAAIGAFVAAALTAGLASYALVCTGVACAAQALARTVPNPGGMHEHRQ